MLTNEEILDKFDGRAIYGGPASVTVISDKGRTGQRGTNFFLSSGNPNTIWDIEDGIGINPLIFKNTPQRYDICIDLSPESDTYLTVFYYFKPPSGPLMWYPNLSLTFSTISKIMEVSFTNGIGSMVIQGIVLPTSGPNAINLQTFNPATDIGIQYNIIGPMPNMSSLTGISITPQLDGTVTATIGFSGIEFNGTTFVPLSGSKTVHLIASQTTVV